MTRTESRIWVFTGDGHGALVAPFRLRPSDISIVTIAHALSQICRFNGHTVSFYSVAEHCARASLLLGDTTGAAWALIHDAPEAYRQDIIRPIKERPEMAWYRVAETDALLLFAHELGLTGPVPSVVESVDNEMLAMEIRDLLEGGQPAREPMRPLPPELAEVLFLRRFVEVFGPIAGAAPHVRMARARLKKLWWARARLAFRKVVLGWRP